MASPTQLTPDTIVVPADVQPAKVAGGILDGALIGSVIGNDLPSSLIGGVVGGVVGGVASNMDMEREMREGHRVHKPGSKGLALSVNALIGGALAVVAAIAVVASFATAPLTIPAGIAIAAGGAALGAWSGNTAYKQREREYAAAQEYFIEHKGSYRGRERENQITEQENAVLKAQLAAKQGDNRSFVERVSTPGAAIQR